MGKDQAVPNPLAQTIAQAVSQLGVAGQVVFEPGKVHPKDWANPGRVRVLIKENGKLVGPGGIKNSTLCVNSVIEQRLAAASVMIIIITITWFVCVMLIIHVPKQNTNFTVSSPNICVKTPPPKSLPRDCALQVCRRPPNPFLLQPLPKDGRWAQSYRCIRPL